MGFEELMIEVHPVIKKLLGSWGGLKTDREDLEQEIYLTIYTKWDDIQRIISEDGAYLEYCRQIGIRTLQRMNRTEHQQLLHIQSPNTNKDGISIFPVNCKNVSFLNDDFLEAQWQKKKQYYAEHKEERKAYQREYDKQHKEQRRQRDKAYREAHKDYYKDYQKKYYAEHKEYHKDYYEAHKDHYKDYQKKWREEHKDYFKKKRLERKNKEV